MQQEIGTGTYIGADLGFRQLPRAIDFDVYVQYEYTKNLS